MGQPRLSSQGICPTPLAWAWPKHIAATTASCHATYFKLPHWPRQVVGGEAAQDSVLSLQSDPGPSAKESHRIMARWTDQAQLRRSQPFLGLVVSAQAPVAFLVPVCLLVRP